jgi:hypothetical protein
MTTDQKSKTLDLLRSGMNRGFTCLSVGVTLRQLRVALREDPRFADEVETAESSFDGMLEAIVSRDATDGNVGSALALRKLQLQAKGQAAHFEMEKKKHRLRREEVGAKIKALDHVGSASERQSVTLRNLSKDEFNEYYSISIKMRDGSYISSDEHRRWGQLTQIILRPVVQENRSTLNGLDEDDPIDKYKWLDK